MPCDTRNTAKTRQIGQQQIVGNANEIDPEIADGLRGMPRDRPNESSGNSDASRGRNEIVKRQADHLREIRHRGFAAVVLPVGVGRETDRGVECEMLAQRGKSLRIQRQKILQSAESRR